jgi:hypothetical protein
MKPKVTMPKPVVIGLIAAELASAVAAWRDLAHRTDDQVRGPRTAWRLFVTLNPGNSLAYWAFGRRQATSTTAP